MLALVGTGLVASFWIIFKIAWKIVKIGFFVMAFLIGFAICAGLSAATNHPQPVWALGAEALAFAWGFSLVRSKISKIVTGLAILATAQAIGHFGFDPAKMKDLAKLPIPGEEKKPTPKKPEAKKPEQKKTAKPAHKAAEKPKPKPAKPKSGEGDE